MKKACNLFVFILCFSFIAKSQDRDFFLINKNDPTIFYQLFYGKSDEIAISDSQSFHGKIIFVSDSILTIEKYFGGTADNVNIKDLKSLKVLIYGDNILYNTDLLVFGFILLFATPIIWLVSEFEEAKGPFIFSAALISSYYVGKYLDSIGSSFDLKKEWKLVKERKINPDN